MTPRASRCRWWCTLALLGIVAGRSDAHTCGSAAPADCAANANTTCTAACTEADLRAAVAVVNACGGHRTITFSFGAGGTCSISMANTSTTASCGEFANAICLTGDDITIDGTNSAGAPGISFLYAGKYTCASCRGSCAGPQPALFAVRGTHNRIRNVALQFFPEGIHLEGGDQNTVEGISTSYYCEDALTVDGGTNHTIRGGKRGCPAGRAGRNAPRRRPRR